MTVNLMVNRFMKTPKMSSNPIKNSKPIINRAMKGAVRQPLMPMSTNVNSNGSIGSNFA
jgi:hypothetical protein